MENAYAPSAVAYNRAEAMGSVTSKFLRRAFTAPVGHGSPISPSNEFVGGTYGIASFQKLSSNATSCQLPFASSVAFHPCSLLVRVSADPSPASVYKVALRGV